MIVIRPDFISEKRLNCFIAYFTYELLQQKLEYSIVENGVIDFKGKKRNLLSIPITFDIETTTLLEDSINNPKDYIVAFPYLYQWYIYDTVFFARTRTECILVFSLIEQKLKELDTSVYVYVHNLSFEYQYLKSMLNIELDSVFLMKNRKVAKFSLEENYITFKDSYILSNMSLEKFCENYCSEEYQKDKELIDYEVERFPWTELNNEILYYSGMDVICLYYAIISIMKKECDTLKTIPMTNTGYVRRSYKKACLGDNTKHYKTKNQKESYKKGKQYRSKYIYKSKLTLEQYEMLERAFRGGNTHASRFKARKILHKVTSYDFSSSYPAVIICCNEYPIGKLMECTESLKTDKDIEYYINKYWVILECLCENFELKDNKKTPVPYIPKSKIITEKFNGVYDNGRIIQQKEKFVYTFLGCEYPIIKKQYKGKIKIIKAYYCIKGYLPDELRKECYFWFKQKTELKNVENKEYEYMRSKNRVNATFGMMVEKIIKQIQDISEDGNIILRNPTKEESEKMIENYYHPSQNKFLQYQWGVTVTALARVRLNELIDMTENDFVYCDTDSVKILNGEKYIKQLEKYNNEWMEYANKCGIDYIAFTKKGEKQILGLADFDGFYNRFITLGAKKYAYESDDKQEDGFIKKNVLHITIAGVPKKIGAKLLGKLENFKEGFVFSIGKDGSLEDRQSWKKRLLYNDTEKFNIICDGHSLYIDTYIAMERTPYELSISEEYKNILSNSQEIYETDDIWY